MNILIKRSPESTVHLWWSCFWPLLCKLHAYFPVFFILLGATVYIQVSYDNTYFVSS